MKYWGQNKSLFSIRIVAYCLMIVYLSMPLIGHAQIFNKKYDFYINSGASFNVEQIAHDSLLITTSNFIPSGLSISSVLLNFNGDSLRKRTYQDSLKNLYMGWANSMNPTHDGGFIMGGGYKDTATDYGYLVKFNRFGDTIWTRTFGDTVNWFTFRQAIQTTDGGYAVVGEYAAVGRRPDGWLVKTDSLGNLQWQKFYSTTIGTFERLSSVFQTVDGGFVLGGTEQEFPNQNIRNYDPIVIKVDSLGNQQWRYKYDTPGNDGVAYAIQTRDGNYVFVSGNSIPENPPYSSVPLSKALMAKLDNNGSLLWDKEYGLVKRNHSLQVVKELANGDLVACGRRRSYQNSTIQGLLLKTDANGDSIWVNTYEYDPSQTSASNYLWDFVQMPDGGFVAAGETSGRIASVSYQDTWLIRVDSNGCILQSCLVGLDDLPQESYELELYPNPSSGIVNIETSKPIESIQIYNIRGQEVKRIENPVGQFELPRELGLYIIKSYSEDGSFLTKKLIKH